jgi:hypothetical protein
MSALMAERRDSGRQESLFEGLAPPRPTPWVRPVAAPSDEQAAESRVDSAVIDVPETEAPLATAGASEPSRGPHAEAAREPAEHRHADAAGYPLPVQGGPARRRLELVREAAEPRSAGVPLGRLTLDDVVSRAWEGLATGLPAACPLCRAEMAAALGGPQSGTCTTCGTTID